MSKATLTAGGYLWPECLTEAWTRHRSGETSEPLREDPSLEWWIQSLRAGPARTSPTPGAGKVSGKGTAAGSGSRSSECFARFAPGSSSARTSQLCLDGEWTPYSETFPAWGLMRSGELFRLLTWEPRTFAGESSSWATPNSADGTGTHGGGQNRSLRTDVSRWSTPQSFDSKDCQRSTEARERALEKGGCRNLREDVLPWPTPKASAENYGQPRENDRGDLQAATCLWGTPTSSSHNGGSLLGPAESRLSTQAERDFPCSHRDPQSKQHGEASSRSTPRLNPRFVEWLMGFPIGWLDSEPLEMQLYRFRLARHLRSFFGDRG